MSNYFEERFGRESDFTLKGRLPRPRTTASRPSGRRATGPANPRQADLAQGVGSSPRSRSTPNSPIQQVSRLGVDPRSSQGQQITDLLLSGYDTNDPMISQAIGELVAEYQETLIGPMTKNVMGPIYRGDNQFGYTAGDAFGELDNLSTENLARLQGRLAGLGLLDSYVPGRKDGDTQKAFGWLLQMANASGLNWARELSSLERIQAEDPEGFLDGRGGLGAGGREGPAPFVEPAYLAPDYATLAQTVKDQLRNELGRDPDDSEMALLTAELSGWDREAFQAEVDASRAEYEASVAAGEGAEGQSGGTVQQVDPLARFKESFESRYRGALQFRDDREEAAVASESVAGSVSTLSQMSGGMG